MLHNPIHSSTARTTRFGRGGILLRSHEALSDEIIQARTPSVFADAKHESRSEKFTFIPTSDLLHGMRKEGFLPFEIRQGLQGICGKAQRHMARLASGFIFGVRHQCQHSDCECL
jgi:hypothetical protein